MKKELFDWENDPELTSKTNIIDLPKSEDYKAQKAFEALEKGYHYTPSGSLEKEIELKSEEPEYDATKTYIDEKGRTYHLSYEGYRVYFDDNGLYSICCDAHGENEEEFFVYKQKKYVYLNSEHTLIKNDAGDVFELDPITKEFVYKPNVISFPGPKR